MRGIGTMTAAAAMVVLSVASPAAALNSFFDVVTDMQVVTGPPYPTDYHRTEVAHEVSGTFERDGQMELGVRRAADIRGNLLGLEFRTAEAHTGSSFEAVTSFEIMHAPSHEGEIYPSESVIAFAIELVSYGGRPGKLIAVRPELPVTDPARFFDAHPDVSSLELVCLVEFDRGIRHELTLLAELPVELRLAMAATVIREQSLANGERSDPVLEDSYFTASPNAMFDVILRLEGDDGLDDLSTVLSMTFSGRFLGGASPVEASTWGAIKALYN